MQRFIIEGGIPLKGQVQISGAKNAALKMIAASLLTSEEVILEGVPRIEDVGEDLEILKNIGVKVTLLGEHTLSLKADEVFSSEIPHSLGVKSRSSVIMLGPLLARFGEAHFPEPSGCRIGGRPIDRHVKALEAMGAQFRLAGGLYKASAARLTGAEFRFEKNTVMGTENLILAAVLAEGKTVIQNAAAEPEVDDLVTLLSTMGAKVGRAEGDPRRVVIEGVRRLSGAQHRILPDRNEVVTFASAAAVTRGDVVMSPVNPQHLTSFLAKLDKMGVGFDVSADSLRVWLEEGQKLAPIEVETSPHPGFMTDWQQPISVLLTQADGESTIHESVYEDRFGYLEELGKMGVKYRRLTPAEAGLPFDPDNYNFDWEREEEPKTLAKIFGPTSLRGARVMIPDLRAGATLVIAALAAEGQSEVYGVEHIDRGYESFEEKLKGLGAKIERVGG